MSDENRTRHIRTNAAGSGHDESTRALGRGGPARQGQAGEPVTRSVSGAGAASQGPAREYDLVAGWLVVVSGPGRGCTREIYFGMNSVGRGEAQRIPLNFGDEAISREGHAFVVFDDIQQDFYIQHGGKSNLVRLNGKPVLAPAALAKGDTIDIGATRLLFVPLCSEDFSWTEAEQK